jgi:imidazoleglycerol-phosphate dehydratase/histidinol-phosphatase
MKKSVCAIYFPGMISFLKMLPDSEFELFMTDCLNERVDKSVVSVIEGEGIKWVSRERVEGSFFDFFIDDKLVDYNDSNAIIDLLTSIRFGERAVEMSRVTNETNISIKLNLDSRESYVVDTGLGFFNHMLAQLSQHGGFFLEIKAKGDLNVDEHHTIEDVGILLGEAFFKALGSKMGICRYGFTLPMDECKAEAIIDFGGRSELVWNVAFKREMIGDMPTEMFKHFFKSFANSAKCTLHISAEGENEHHKIEGVFKAVARAIKSAVKRELSEYQLPTTKGIL